MAQDVNQLVEVYLSMRTALDKLADEYSTAKAKILLDQEKVEDELFKTLQETNTTSLRTEHGTVFTTKQTSIKIADWQIFFEHLKKKKRWELLKHAASKDAVLAYMEETKQPVPGIDMSQRLQISVRRK